MLNLHRDKKNVRREPGRDGKILCDHRQDGNDEVHLAISEMKERRKKKKEKSYTQYTTMRTSLFPFQSLNQNHTVCNIHY